MLGFVEHVKETSAEDSVLFIVLVFHIVVFKEK